MLISVTSKPPSENKLDSLYLASAPTAVASLLPLFFNQFRQLQGITRHLTQAGTPQPNGAAERRNRSLLEMSRSVSLSGAQPNFLWGKLLLTASYLQNRISGKSTPLSSPHELLTGRKPNLAHLYTIGCTAHVHVPASKRTKLFSHIIRPHRLRHRNKSQSLLQSRAPEDPNLPRHHLRRQPVPPAVKKSYCSTRSTSSTSDYHLRFGITSCPTL